MKAVKKISKFAPVKVKNKEHSN